MKVLRYEKTLQTKKPKTKYYMKVLLTHSSSIQVYSEAVIMEETENTETSY